MAKLSILKGATSVIGRIFVQNSASNLGAGLTGLSNASANLTCTVAREDDGNAAGVAITLTAGTRGTWATGSIVEKDSANMPGIYELGFTNASLAAGSRSSTYYLKGAANMAPVVFDIELTGTDNQDGVHGGMSALPNSAIGHNSPMMTIASLPGIKANTALNNYPILMTANGVPTTGLSCSVTRSIDGGAFGAGTLGAVSEIANGWYAFNFGAGDLNGTNIGVRITATSADDRDFTITTNPNS